MSSLVSHCGVDLLKVEGYLEVQRVAGIPHLTVRGRVRKRVSQGIQQYYTKHYAILHCEVKLSCS